MPELRPYYIAGKWKYSDEKLKVINPANGQTVSNTSYVRLVYVRGLQQHRHEVRTSGWGSTVAKSEAAVLA